MTSLVFTVEGTPVPKARARVMTGYSFTPKTTRDFEALVRRAAEAALKDCPGWSPSHPAGYRVRVAVYRVARRGDLDNYVKSCTDALNKTAVLADDRLIVELHAVLLLDRERPRTWIEVTPKGA